MEIGKKYTANAHLEYSQRNPGIQSPRQLHGVHRSDQVVLGEVLMGMMRIMLLHARLALGPWRRRIYALLYVGDEERELRCTHLSTVPEAIKRVLIGQSHKRTRCR